MSKKRGVVVLSFDDGRIDNYAVYMEILKTYNFPMTINIATGYINKEIEIGGCNPAPLTGKQIQQLYQTGAVEFAGHGYHHKNDLEDIQIGRKMLLEWLGLPKDSRIGFASPKSGMTPEYVRQNGSELKCAGFKYIRTGPETRSLRWTRTLCRKVSRILHLPFLYTIAYKESLQKNKDGILITSIPIWRDTTVREIMNLISEAERQKAVCVLMFHSIEIRPKDLWSFDKNKFKRLCEFLKSEESADRICIMNTSDAFDIL